MQQAVAEVDTIKAPGALNRTSPQGQVVEVDTVKAPGALIKKKLEQLMKY